MTFLMLFSSKASNRCWILAVNAGPTGECTTSTSRTSISFSAASKNNYKYV